MTQPGSAEGQVQRRPVEQVGREEPDVAWPHSGSTPRSRRPATAARTIGASGGVCDHSPPPMRPHIEIRIASNIEVSPQLGQDLVLPLVGNQPRVELCCGLVWQDRLRPWSGISPQMPSRLSVGVKKYRRKRPTVVSSSRNASTCQSCLNGSSPKVSARVCTADSPPQSAGARCRKPVNRDRSAIDGYSVESAAIRRQAGLSTIDFWLA